MDDHWQYLICEVETDGVHDREREPDGVEAGNEAQEAKLEDVARNAEAERDRYGDHSA